MADDAAARRRRIIKAIKEEWVEATAATGDKIDIYLSGFRPLVDAHMHFQSNNCCPLPLQWDIVGRGISNASLGTVSSRSKDNRRTMNDTAAGWTATNVGGVGRMGKVGRLRTELIAELYMGKVDTSDINRQNAMSVMTEQEWDQLVKTKGVAAARTEASQRATVDSLNQTSLDKYADDFYNTTGYYYKNQHVYHMAIPLMMNLGYAHFWGRFRIPIYIPYQNHFFYINDFIALSTYVITIIGSAGNRIINISDGIITPENSSTSDITGSGITDTDPLYAKFIAGDKFSTNFYQEEFRKFTAYKTVISSGSAKPKEKFSISFSGDQTLCDTLVKKQYIHLLEQVPDEHAEVYESLATQFKWSTRALLKYPLQYFLFFHVDPRNAIRNDADIAPSVQVLKNDHAFFSYTLDRSANIDYDDKTNQKNLLNLTPAEPSSNSSYFQNHLQVPENTLPLDTIMKSMIHTSSKSGAICWGIKMYPRLGFAPDDFKNHPVLQNLYQNCSSNQVPLTSHCSPGGMDIADFYNFERYAYARSRTQYKHSDSATFFDNNYDTPSNWENVLKSYPDLKLDLAHFGGYDLWNKVGSFAKQDKNPVDLSKVPPQDPKARYVTWIKKICALTRDYANCYTDISYFNNTLDWTNNYPSQIVENLVYLLNNFPSLKDRLMMGTDWYMIELDGFEGVGKYLKQMFLMLKEVSKRVNYDAWHQFGVVNPFRFLGLISGAKGVSGPYKIDQILLDKYESEIKKILNNKGLMKYYGLNDDKEKINESLQENRNRFRENPSIPDSSDIKDESGKLLILSE